MRARAYYDHPSIHDHWGADQVFSLKTQTCSVEVQYATTHPLVPERSWLIRNEVHHYKILLFPLVGQQRLYESLGLIGEFRSVTERHTNSEHYFIHNSEEYVYDVRSGLQELSITDTES
ncbi:hypothetical protein TNCV_741891 [Trichonephila clavipes]|nr:hypothetical protein TNCV_741891 [Trichonephila clavipes]